MNGIQSRGNGGAIFADSSTISIQGMSSLNSFAYGPHGGFIAAQSGSSIRCSWCLVNNSGFLGISSFNSSDGYGQGGAFFMFKSSLTLLYTNITNSSANFGGAVYLNVDCPSIFNYTNFIGNTALFGGGAIGIRNSISTYSNVLFANNNALVQGGAMTLELWNGTIYRASFTGPVSFINNNVLDQTIGYGGAISMDTQSTLEINTTQLVITGNKAVFGSAILCSNYFFGVAYGLITYNPPPSEVQSGLYPKIQGIIFFSQKSFAYYMSQNNPFKGIPDIILDSEPITLQFPSNNISAKTITLPNITDVVIPPVQIQLSNAFGLPIQTINLTNPYIVKLELNSSDGSPLLRTYKGVLRPGLPVEFHNISLENQIISKGKLIYTFSYDYSDPLHSYTVNFNTNNQNYDDGYKNLTAINEVNAALAQLSTGSSQAQMIIPHCSENGTIVQLIGYNNNNSLPIYKCVPILKTSQSAQIITGSLSGIFAILTIALGIYAYRNKEVKVYKVKSSFFTTIITIGCLIQLISVIFQSLVTSTSLPCMTVQWFELCGFMMVCVSLGLKTYRIRMIFLDPWSTVGKQYILKNNVLGSGVALGVAAAIVLLIAWTVVENIQLNTIYISKDAALFGYQYGWVQTDRCISNRGTAVFPLVSAAIHVVAEIILVYVAFTARKVMPLFNESRLIFTVSFFWLICTTLFVAIEMVTAQSEIWKPWEFCS